MRNAILAAIALVIISLSSMVSASATCGPNNPNVGGLQGQDCIGWERLIAQNNALRAHNLQRAGGGPVYMPGRAAPLGYGVPVAQGRPMGYGGGHGGGMQGGSFNTGGQIRKEFEYHNSITTTSCLYRETTHTHCVNGQCTTEQSRQPCP
jgi:hypothetical protein